MGRRWCLLAGSACLALLLALPALAQALKPIRPDFERLADGKGAQVYNRALSTLRDGDRVAVHLDARPGDGGALLDGILLSEGTIEVDLRGKDVPQRSFVGIAFHVVDWTTYEAVYFRPFNFRAAGAEQQSHSVQYISHPLNTWQKLRDERPRQFEKSIDPAPDPNGWFHARIVLGKNRVEVYVNGASVPSLAVDDLGDQRNGGVALWVGNGSDGSYANLTIVPTAAAGPPPVSKQTMSQAILTGNLARVKTLAEADSRALGSEQPGGATPLHLAASRGQRSIVEYLVSRGADVNASSRHSGTPLDVAYEADRGEIVAWLESRGARFTPLRFTVTRLTPAVHRVAFPWGMMNNILVVSGTDGALIVDSGFSKRALEELRKTVTGFSPAGVRYVINTHNHGDHVVGNAMAPSPAAVINASTLKAPPAGLSIVRQAGPLKGRSGRSLPVGYTLRAVGAEATLIPRPGLHSDADLIVYFPGESIVAMGDLLLSESVPAVQDLAGYLTFLQDVLDVFPEDTTFVSGHGRDLSAKEVKAYRDALSEMIGIVRTNLEAGRTVEQMVSADILKEYKGRYGLLDFLNPDTLIPRAVAGLRQGSLK